MKFLAYSAGGGLIAGIFLLLILQTGASENEAAPPAPQRVMSHVHVTKVPLVTYPTEVVDAR